jgi:hypothetical protein
LCDRHLVLGFERLDELDPEGRSSRLQPSER